MVKPKETRANMQSQNYENLWMSQFFKQFAKQQYSYPLVEDNVEDSWLPVSGSIFCLFVLGEYKGEIEMTLFHALNGSSDFPVTPN